MSKDPCFIPVEELRRLTPLPPLSIEKLCEHVKTIVFNFEP